ncbi:MAG: hypothetical protein KDA85_18445, partial [Planctomycetaceae bacterium]|nr:hypothetical protein [Planctomycetaceae bacterium]
EVRVAADTDADSINLITVKSMSQSQPSAITGTSDTRPSPVRWSRFAPLLLPGLLWVVFVVWQYNEYQQQCEQIQRSLTEEAETLSNAITGSLRSHRWFGPFVQQQLPVMLKTLAKNDHVISIAVVVNQDFETPYTAGDAAQIDFSLQEGEHTRPTTLQLVHRFTQETNPPLIQGILQDDIRRPPTEDFMVFVVLDRSITIQRTQQEASNRILIVALGSLVLIAAGRGWQFSVRLARAEGRTRLLTAETRHLRELGQAAAGLAHETRNPLGLIRGWTQRLVDKGLPTDEQQEQAEAILEECDRVTAGINHFLAYARQAEIQLETVSLPQLINELQILLQSDLDEHRLTFTLRTDAASEFILADRNQLRQVLFNLLQNAISFAPPDSAISLTTTIPRPGEIQLDVADEGSGVSADILQSLFEPYVTRREGGTGLGLSIVKRIAAAHHWDVRYLPGHRQGQDHGSIFRISGIRSVSPQPPLG